MRCPRCSRELSLREYAWTHRHEPPLALKVIGAVMMGIGLGSILVGLGRVI